MTISQFVDTVVFMTIAFYGLFPLANAIAGQYLIKVVIAVTVTPLMYLGVGLLGNRKEESLQPVEARREG